MSTYVFRATAMAVVKASGTVDANSPQDAQLEAHILLSGGNGDWVYDGLGDEEIEIEVEELHPVKPQDPQKPLRIKVRRAFRELTGMSFARTFEEDIKCFYERLCRAKRPWKKELIEDAKSLLELAADRAGDCAVFNKGGQAYVALKAINKCTL